MTQQTALVGPRRVLTLESVQGATRYLVPVARALFGAIFVLSATAHASRPMIAMAAHAGVPFAALTVPLSGLMALVGGLSVMVGYRARLGAALLVAFLVPVTLAMHRFWGVSDPATAQLQMVMFMKNLALIGGALLITHFGSGPFGLDARRGAR